MEEYMDLFPSFFDNEEIIEKPFPSSFDNEKPESSSRVGIKFPFHKHPLYQIKGSSKACVGCHEVRVDPDGGYACDDADKEFWCMDFYIHKSCIEIYNPSHPTHPLTLTWLEDESGRCYICDKYLRMYVYSYPFCSDIAVCGRCATKEFYIDPKKSHDHPLFMLLKGYFSFSCDACGVTDDSSCLCLCIPCRFTIHKRCINLPRVICINRHDHRISHVPRLGSGEWGCGVCRKTIDGRYGSYSCSTCSFACHSRCATRRDIWDGIELEGVPEDDPKDIIPFKVVKRRVIKHFSHDHYLRFITKYNILHEENNQCSACVLPILSDPSYICMHCDFRLHESCANLPRKKRHMSNEKQFTLYAPGERAFMCCVCDQHCNGFEYRTKDYFSIDIRCALIYDGYVHKSQPHSMLLFSERYSCSNEACSRCGRRNLTYMLTFDGCHNLFMCYKCATIPGVAMHKHDVHPLSLQFGENTSGDYWCEICEKKTDPNEWFYTCDECCTTLHIDCVLGEEPYLRFGSTFTWRTFEYKVLCNNFTSRPKCWYCNNRSQDVFVFKCLGLWASFYCSFHCIKSEFICFG